MALMSDASKNHDFIIFVPVTARTHHPTFEKRGHFVFKKKFTVTQDTQRRVDTNFNSSHE